jgi:hypothetical protein
VRRVLRRWSATGAVALPLLFALSSDVEAVEGTLRIKARLREGPSKQTTLLGWVDAGTVVEVIEEKSGWRRIQLPDGRGGYVWGDHFATATPPVDGAEPAAVVARAEAASPPTTIAAAASAPDDLRSLRAEVEALRNRPESVPSAALEQLRGEVSRLAAAQQELARRLDARGPEPSGPISVPIEGTASAAAIFLVAGGLVGWIASRLMQRWRDRRSRIRI